MINFLGNSVAFGQQANIVGNSAPAAPAAAPGATTAAQNAATLDHLPHGIRGLAEYPLMVIPGWLALLLATLFTGAVIWGLWYWWKKTHPKVVIEKKVHPLDRLREEIAQLRPPEPFIDKVQEDYFYNLSMALRRFIEELLKIPATDRTLKELREPLRLRLPLSRERVAEVLAFLERADMIKFAKAVTSLEEARRCHDDVKLWIAYLMPRELDFMTVESDQPGAQTAQFEEVAHRS
jgi:hypothetical protein